MLLLLCITLLLYLDAVLFTSGMYAAVCDVVSQGTEVRKMMETERRRPKETGDAAQHEVYGVPCINFGTKQIANGAAPSQPQHTSYYYIPYHAQSTCVPGRSSMREDLPCEEPLPKLWSLNLAPGGDIVDRGPCLDDFVLVESLQLGESRYWRVKERGRDDSITHVLCETK